MNDDTPSLSRALKLMEEHLQHLKEEGVTDVEVDPAILRAGPPVRPAATAPVAARIPEVTMAPPRTRPAAAPVTPPAPRPVQAAAPAVAGDPVSGLAAIAARIATCQQCGLCRTRGRTVPGQGNPRPEIMFVGEGPGTDEDKQGLAFIGRAGQLLTRLITAMGFTRDEVFIGNIVKCRPTIDNAGERDRPPTPEEMAACLPYLHEQIALLKPKVIVALGATAVKGLFGDQGVGITKLRGKFLQFDGIDVMPTFHPSYLLRQGGDGNTNNQAYWDVWSDCVAALKKIGREPPAKKK